MGRYFFFFTCFFFTFFPFLSSCLSSFLSFFISFFLSFFLSSFLSFFLSSFLPFFLSFFLSIDLSFYLSFKFKPNSIILSLSPSECGDLREPVTEEEERRGRSWDVQLALALLDATAGTQLGGSDPEGRYYDYN